MRDIEDIKGALERYRREKLESENLMEVALRERSEFAYNVYRDNLIKSEHYIEILEYVLGA